MPGLEFTESKVLENVAYLNRKFNPFHIYFKYRGWDEFDSPSDLSYVLRYDCDNDGEPECCPQGIADPDGFGILGRCQISSLFSWTFNNGYDVPNAMNVYVPWGTEGGFGGVAQGIGSRRCVVPARSLDPSINSSAAPGHEIAHCLGLYHTRAKGNGYSNKEHTTRVEFLLDGSINPDFNAKDEDDEVVDTAANTDFWYGGTFLILILIAHMSLEMKLMNLV